MSARRRALSLIGILAIVALSVCACGQSGQPPEEPVGPEPLQAGPAQAEAVEEEPAQVEAVEAEPAEDQPPQPEPPQGEPAQDQPPEPQPAGDIDLVGIWTSEDMTDLGLLRTEMILQRNGRYSYQVVWGELMTWEAGRYEAGEGFIHFALEDYGPTTYKGTDLQRPTSWTVFYTVVDQDTMIWEDRILGTQWAVHRQ